MKIAVVIGSVRENRVSPRLASWVMRTANARASEHDWKLIDLKDFALPLFDEPLPPMAGQRPALSEGVKKYLTAMDEADGFIIVTAEHNHGMPASLKNAIDHLDYQLMKKPVAIVSHGVVGGARAAEQVKLVVNSNLGAVPVPGHVPFYGRVAELIDEAGNLTAGPDANETGLQALIEIVTWYAQALKAAREQ